jgi:hypothetical protein
MVASKVHRIPHITLILDSVSCLLRYGCLVPSEVLGCGERLGSIFSTILRPEKLRVDFCSISCKSKLTVSLIVIHESMARSLLGLRQRLQMRATDDYVDYCM